MRRAAASTPLITPWLLIGFIPGGRSASAGLPACALAPPACALRLGGTPSSCNRKPNGSGLKGRGDGVSGPKMPSGSKTHCIPLVPLLTGPGEQAVGSDDEGDVMSEHAVSDPGGTGRSLPRLGPYLIVARLWCFGASIYPAS